MNQILLLPSIDGQEYAMAVVIPKGMSIGAAQEAVCAAREAAQRASIEDSWDDMVPLMEVAGLVVLPVIHDGPMWDMTVVSAEERPA